MAMSLETTPNRDENIYTLGSGVERDEKRKAGSIGPPKPRFPSKRVFVDHKRWIMRRVARSAPATIWIQGINRNAPLPRRPVPRQRRALTVLARAGLSARHIGGIRYS